MKHRRFPPGLGIFTPADMKRLRGDASPSTHLARYAAAKDARKRRVMAVACPDCLAAEGRPCLTTGRS